MNHYIPDWMFILSVLLSCDTIGLIIINNSPDWIRTLCYIADDLFGLLK